ncbi:Metallo-dependent phosphatase-like protein [Mycena vulgaris]|nr:Metallo-dependent phosphatase-like protein [Mycena vulgaris]
MQSILLALAFAGAALACGDDHGHAAPGGHREAHARLSRLLTRGSFNILHTTDSHGWLLGHQKMSFPEPNYSGDFGDFASFVSHMKELAIKTDVDLLLVDSGDLHDGTGLSDGYPIGGVDAQQSNEFFKQLPYDVLAIGRHSLFPFLQKLKFSPGNMSSEHTRYAQHLCPRFKGRYLSSNVNITVNGVSKPVGSRFAKFKTRKGRAVTAPGVLFNFKGNAANTTVQKVEDMVKEAWFADAIRDEPDLFLLAGAHHIRDCLQLDGRSMSLESGRYMETIGWMSADLPEPKGYHGGYYRHNGEDQRHFQSTKNITFSRRYLDPNRVTFEYHTGRGNFSFDTTRGRSITKGLEQVAKKFDLSFMYGTAPHDFNIYQAPFPSNKSLLSLMSEVMPVALTVNNMRASIPHIMITNSGSLRFDIFAGPFTKNDQLTVLSYADPFLYISNVPFSVANGVLPVLNGAPGAGVKNRKRDEAVEAELWERGGYGGAEYGARRGGTLAVANLTLGYVTTDACPGVGDDHTAHAARFLEKQLIGIFNGLQKDKLYTTADVSKYSNVLATEVLGIMRSRRRGKESPIPT